jgi:hypothetical protein
MVTHHLEHKNMFLSGRDQLMRLMIVLLGGWLAVRRFDGGGGERSTNNCDFL